MKYTQLRRTGLTVSRVCLETMNFSFQITEADADLMMDKALDYTRRRGLSVLSFGLAVWHLASIRLRKRR